MLYSVTLFSDVVVNNVRTTCLILYAGKNFRGAKFV